MRRKTLTYFLAGILAISLAACGSASQSGQNASTNQTATESQTEKAGTVDKTDESNAASEIADASKAESANATTAPIKPQLMDSSKETSTTEEKKKAEVTPTTPVETAGTGEKKHNIYGHIGDYDADDMSVSFDISHADGNDTGYITAYYKGEKLWDVTTASVPSAQIDRVCGLSKYRDAFYYTEGGTVVCLDLQTGDERWRNSDFGGSPANGAFYFADDGKLYITGYFGPDLFICDKDGATVKCIAGFNDDYYWPYEVSVDEDASLVKIVYEMYPEGESDTLSISTKDYSVKTGDATYEDISEAADKGQIYYPKVKDYLSLRKEASTDAEVIDKLKNGTAMELIGYEKDMAKVKVVDSGKVGYVNPKYITKEKTSSGGSSSGGNSSSKSVDDYGLKAGMTVYANVKEYLSLRAEPSTSGDVIARLPDWTKMTVLDAPQGKFVNVRVEESGLTGYVHIDFLSF